MLAGRLMIYKLNIPMAFARSLRIAMGSKKARRIVPSGSRLLKVKIGGMKAVVDTLTCADVIDKINQ